MTERAGDRPGARERIVVVTTSYPARENDPSGHFVESEVLALSASGHEVTVIAPRPATGAEERPGVSWIDGGSAFGWPGASSRVRARPWRAFGAMGFVLRARRALRREAGVTRVIAHFALPSAWPIATARSPHVPLEVVVHGSDARLLVRLPSFVRTRVAQALRSADVRAVSSELRELLVLALGPAIRERIRVAPAPVDVLGVPARGEARRLLGVDACERLIVVAGRLVPEKRVDVALAATRLAGTSRVVVVGDGPERERLARDFPEATFTGLLPRDRALTWISAADILLSASTREGAPSVIREARALGTSVIARASGGLPAEDGGLFVLEGA